MDNQIQGEVTGSAVFPPPAPHTGRHCMQRCWYGHRWHRRGQLRPTRWPRHCDHDGVGIRRRREPRHPVDTIERRACIRTSGAARALSPLQHPADGVYADARMCRTGGGTAKVMKQIIGNALLLKIRKAN
jgi:hypothetical protein